MGGLYDAAKVIGDMKGGLRLAGLHECSAAGDLRAGTGRAGEVSDCIYGEGRGTEYRVAEVVSCIDSISTYCATRFPIYLGSLEAPALNVVLKLG